MTKMLFLLFCLIFLSSCSTDSSGEIRVPGLVDGDVITMKALVPGQVGEITVREGERLSKNVPLVVIESDKTENKLQNLEIGLKEIDINEAKLKHRLEYVRHHLGYLKRQVQRFTRLAEKKSLPGEKLETMELKLKEARLSETDIQKSLETLAVKRNEIRNRKAYLELILQDHRIKSPVDGIIIQRFVSKGETVFPGTALLDILDIASLYIEIFVEGREMAGLKLNQKARILVDGIKDRRFEGILTYFGSKAEFSPKYILSEKERESLLYRVKITLQQDFDVFKLGMPVTVILSKNK